MSLTNTLREKAVDYILDHRYQEFIGITYEDIVRDSCFRYALDQIIPFMPRTIGKWWGPVCKDNIWQKSEADVVAYDDRHLLVGECKYHNKAAGLKELDDLNLKKLSSFLPAAGNFFICLPAEAVFLKICNLFRIHM